MTKFFKTEVMTGDSPLGSDGAKPITFPRKTLLDEMVDTFWVDDSRVTE